MNDWDDLLLTGGFAPRATVFGGLTAEQVQARPGQVPHSIYQELWHAAMVLKISLDDGRAALERWPYEQHFPLASGPAGQQEWDDLVSTFLTYSNRAVTLAEDQDWLNAAEPGSPHAAWRGALEFLAVHTAHHLGNSVGLQLIMNIWPPASPARPHSDSGRMSHRPWVQSDKRREAARRGQPRCSGQEAARRGQPLQKAFPGRGTLQLRISPVSPNSG